jgi:hypothetical protein
MIYIGYQTTIHRHEQLLRRWRCPTSIRETAITNIAIQRKKKVRNHTGLYKFSIKFGDS